MGEYFIESVDWPSLHGNVDPHCVKVCHLFVRLLRWVVYSMSNVFVRLCLCVLFVRLGDVYRN